MNPDVAVTLPRGDESSGMAVMFADYLEANFRDFPSKRRIARRMRSPIALVANDRKVAITLRFARSFVSVEDDAAPDAEACLAGPFFLLTKVASSQPIPPEDLKQLEVTGLKRHPVQIAYCAALLRTPASFYEDEAASDSPVGTTKGRI